ncbi:diguanylate cyclase domain-containing protein [Lacrimispora sp.]|uniref:GGDEF domain-containing protein n=1 Tax=Lacrimispora sp. TaxID=2719234 RepID=UPI0039E23EFF
MIYYIQTSATGLILTLIIYFHMGRHAFYQESSQRIFRGLVVSNIVLLLLEMLVNIFTGQDSPEARLLLPVIVWVFYTLNPLPPALLVLYLDSFVRKRGKRSAWLFSVVIMLPFLLNAVFSTVSLFGEYAFYIDAQNVYRRGPDFWLMPAVCYSYIAFYLIHALLHGKSISKHDYKYLLLVALPPIIAGILQVTFYGISVLWIALTFSLLITYLNLQSSHMYMDHLTGVGNRMQFDLVVRTMARRKKSVSGIIVDIDKFKHINDVYGHDMGDKALEKVGILLKSSLRKGDFVTRIGGDEFFVLIDADSMKSLENTVRRIQEHIEQLNAAPKFPFELHLSMGYDIWDITGGQTWEQFYKLIDEKMYAEKSAKETS